LHFGAVRGIIRGFTAEETNPEHFMETASKPPSKARVILMWLLMVGMILFWAVFWTWHNRNNAPSPEAEAEAAPMVVHSVITLFVGGFFLVLGVMGYLAAIFSGCFTFNYQRPVWNAVKAKKFFANIVVTVALALGLGFLLAAFLGPVLRMLGLDAGMANLLPVMVMVVGVQVAQLWVLMWSPLEKRIITKRLAALGVKPEQMQTAALVGLSNPASGFARRFGAIEEDMGALWVGPEQLIYWGDGEQFGITRQQIEHIERKADNRSTSVLGGIAHVILHIRLPDGKIRQIRLHTEGLWTMGGKRKAMDALAGAIDRWNAGQQ
jgi:hypothetical protein